MTSFNTMRWGALAGLAVVLTGPSVTWAQRSPNDDADSYSDARNNRNESEPPRLMRGGIMQQLRSVTESVIGTYDDKPSSNTKNSKAENRPGVPTPPPLAANELCQNHAFAVMLRKIFSRPNHHQPNPIDRPMQVARGRVSF